MAQQNEEHSRPPLAPVLNTPRNEAVVDGQDVTFEWEPVDDARGYRLEVASDSGFGSIVFAAETTGETRARIQGEFPTDGETYFWRVIAVGAEGMSSGDSIESFISATPEMAAKHLDRPEEEVDPAVSLAKSAAVTAGREATGSKKLADEEYEEGVEPESVASGQILGLALAIGAAVIMIACILIFWTSSVYSETRERAVALSGYPELRETRAAGTGQLTQYRVIDEAEGIYGIPIEQAIDRLVEEERAAGPRAYSREVPLLPGTARADGGSQR